MDTLTIPATDLYADDETVVAEWHGDGEQYQAHFQILDVPEEADVERDEEAIFVALARLTETREFADEATIEDVPDGVLWAVDHHAAPTAANPENIDDGDRDDDAPGRGVA
jgi:hypothetical protein